MRLHYLLFLFIFFFSELTLYSYQPPPVIDDKFIQDSLKLQKMLDSAEYKIHSSVIIAFKISEEAMEFAIKTKQQILIANVYETRSLLYFQSGNNYLARKYSDSAFTIYKQLGNEVKIDFNQIRKGELFYYSFEFAEAFKTFLKVIDGTNNINDKHSISDSKYYLGRIFQYLKNYDQSDKYFLEALSVSEEIKDSSRIGRDKIFYGDNLNHKGLILEARKIYLEVYNIAKSIKDYNLQIDALRFIGDTYHDLEKSKQCLEYYFEAINLALNIQNFRQAADLFTKISNYYSEKNDDESNLFYLRKSLELRMKMGIPAYLASSMLNIGNYYFRIKNNDSACYYLNKALEYCSENDNNFYQCKAYKQLYSIYKEKKDFENALKYYELYSLENDTLNIQKNNNEIMSIIINYELKRREAQLINEHLTAQRLYLIIFLIISLFLLILLIIFYQKERIAAKQLRLNNISLNNAIEKQIAAEKVLRESEEKYRNLTNNLPLGVYRVNLKGDLMFANPKFIEIINFITEIISFKANINLFEFGLIKNNSVSVLDSTVSHSEEIPLQTNNDKRIWINNIFQPFKVDGEIIGFEGIIEDITEKKYFLEEIQKAKDLAEEGSRVKGIILNNLGHELRTPLNIILGFAQSLRVQSDMKAKEETIEYIYSGMLRLHKTLESLLILTQIESGSLRYKTKSINVYECLESYLLSHKRNIIQKGLTFNFKFSETDVESFIDESLFKIVIDNVLDNSLKFTAEGGVSVELMKIESIPGNLIKIEISDTGSGIPEQNLMKIFEPFRQSSEGLARTNEGLGIGLTISNKIIELFNGKLQIASSENSGTKVTIILQESNEI